MQNQGHVIDNEDFLKMYLPKLSVRIRLIIKKLIDIEFLQLKSFRAV